MLGRRPCVTREQSAAGSRPRGRSASCFHLYRATSPRVGSRLGDTLPMPSERPAQCEVWAGTDKATSVYGIIEVWQRGPILRCPPRLQTITVLGRPAQFGPISDGSSVLFYGRRSCERRAITGRSWLIRDHAGEFSAPSRTTSRLFARSDGVSQKAKKPRPADRPGSGTSRRGESSCGSVVTAVRNPLSARQILGDCIFQCDQRRQRSNRIADLHDHPVVI